MKRALIGIFGVVTLSLCSACGAGENGETEEWVASDAAEIGEAGCADPTSFDQVKLGLPPPFVSPATYSNPSCYKAWVVYLGDYVAASNRRFQVLWNAALPTTKATCEAAWVRADVYKWNGSSFQFVEKISETGFWSGSTCTLKGRSLQATSGTYTFALTARTSTASSAPTRSVALGTVIVL
jgi:hypothetical protein